MSAEADELVKLAELLFQREEPDSVYLLMKAAGYDHRVLFAASDKAEQEGLYAVPEELKNAAIDALRSGDAPFEGRSADSGPACPNVTVDLNFVRRRTDESGKPFLNVLVNVARQALVVANRRDAQERLNEVLQLSADQGDLEEECMGIVASYVNLTE